MAARSFPNNQGYVKFNLGVPQLVTLSSMDAVPTRGFRNEMQYMYKLEGGKVMFVPPGVSQYFKDNSLQPGRSISITRGRAPDGHNVQWTVKPESEAPREVPAVWTGQKAAAIIESAPLEEYLDDAPSAPSSPSLPSVADSKLARALKTAVAAAHQAELFGQEIGYPFQFSPSDIRAMGISTFIGMGANRG